MKRTKKQPKALPVRRHESQSGVTRLRKDIHPEDVLVSTRVASLVTQHDRDYITRRRRDADIPPAGFRGFHAVWAMRDLWEILSRESGAANPAPDTLAPIARKAWYQSENARLDLEREAAKLIPAEEVAATQARIAGVLNRMLDHAVAGLPACGLSPEMVSRVRQHFQEGRALLADYGAQRFDAPAQ